MNCNASDSKVHKELKIDGSLRSSQNSDSDEMDVVGMQCKKVFIGMRFALTLTNNI